MLQLYVFSRKLVLRCEMLLSSDKDNKSYATILRGLMYLVDQIVNYKMSQTVRDRLFCIH